VFDGQAWVRAGRAEEAKDNERRYDKRVSFVKHPSISLFFS
jgi:hypothetical protein